MYHSQARLQTCFVTVSFSQKLEVPSTGSARFVRDGIKLTPVCD